MRGPTAVRRWGQVSFSIGGVGFPRLGVIPDKRHALGRPLSTGTPPPLSRICQNSLDHLLAGRTQDR